MLTHLSSRNSSNDYTEVRSALSVKKEIISGEAQTDWG